MQHACRKQCGVDLVAACQLVYFSALQFEVFKNTCKFMARNVAQPHVSASTHSRLIQLHTQQDDSAHLRPVQAHPLARLKPAEDYDTHDIAPRPARGLLQRKLTGPTRLRWRQVAYEELLEARMQVCVCRAEDAPRGRHRLLPRHHARV